DGSGQAIEAAMSSDTLGIFLPSTTDPSPRQHIRLVPPTTEGEGGMWVDLTVVKKYDPALFLQTLRADGPWVLVAIHPDTPEIIARTVNSDASVRDFVAKYEGKLNIYYSVNPTRTAVVKKPSKADIAAIEFLLADLDPREGETSEDAKKRYLA